MDLVKWIETAISQLENTARAALWSGDERWIAGCRASETRDSKWYIADSYDEAAVFTVEATAADDQAVARHIALNDPVAVIHRCQTGREALNHLKTIIGGDYIDDGELPLAEWMLERLAKSYGHQP